MVTLTFSYIFWFQRTLTTNIENHSFRYAVHLWRWSMLFTPSSDSIPVWYQFKVSNYTVVCLWIAVQMTLRVDLLSTVTHLLRRFKQPSKQKMFIKCWANVGPPSTTLGQHYPSMGLISCWRCTFQYLDGTGCRLPFLCHALVEMALRVGFPASVTPLLRRVRRV